MSTNLDTRRLSGTELVTKEHAQDGLSLLPCMFYTVSIIYISLYICMYVNIGISVIINEIRGHVQFRSARSGTKGVLETGM